MFSGVPKINKSYCINFSKTYDEEFLSKNDEFQADFLKDVNSGRLIEARLHKDRRVSILFQNEGLYTFQLIDASKD